MLYDNNPVPQNVKYTIVAARSNSPLTEAEKSLELYDLETLFPETDYLKQKEWLIKNTPYFSTMEGFTGEETSEDLT